MKNTNFFKSCEMCGKEFKTRPYLISIGKGKYCSSACYFKSKNGKRYKTVKVYCFFCGKPIIRNKHKIKNSKMREGKLLVFCSRRCQGRDKTIMMSGSNNWNWTGGRSPRPLNCLLYRTWRKIIFMRDKFTCQKCGDDTGRNLNAHHIKPWAKYPQYRYYLENGITLCNSCHKKEHHK